MVHTIYYIHALVMYSFTRHHVLIKEEFICYIIITDIILLDWPSDAGLYNRVTVFHEIHVLDKASRDKVASGSTSGVNFCFNYQPKEQ